MIKSVSKMTLLLAILMTGTAEATQSSTTMPPENFPKPVRQAKARVLIQKVSVVRHPTHGYSYTVSDVCDKTAMVDVFDVRGLVEPGWEVAEVMTCEADIKGNKIVLRGSAVIGILDHSIFPGDPVSVVRVNHFRLRSSAADGSFDRLIANGDVFSRDIAAGAIVFLEENTPFDCPPGGTCSPVETDIFSAIVEFGP